ncbi:MAG: transglycosylase domain-containing protein [Candidatus Colwellbacteria bacterium]|nr:transglycosylase domain-containing protein [Candidatus Colwellbacteria bacterium]MDD4818586.1 transglycosylase domain-containing protein [Candidatus Colwellbacteria bacterium]
MKKIPFKKIAIWLGGLIITSAVVGFLGFFYLSRNLPTAFEITNQELVESTKIYDRTGEKLLYEIHGEEKRTYLSAEDIPDIIRQATVAVEDSGFYSHPAIDIRGIIRAFIVDIKKGYRAQGGSTITQQVAKNSFLTTEKSIIRKLKEIILAFRLEQVYTKDEILNLYLNQVPYGQNAYGIEAASRIYFDKPAKEINLSEAAMLAAIPQASSYYSPWGSHTIELEERRLFVLSQMKTTGVIDDQQYEYAVKNKPEVMPRPKEASFALAPHFIIEIQEYLNNKYGENFVSRAGLKVITTLDTELQEIANKTVEDGALRNTDLYSGHNAALISMDPKTGQVLALAGSKDYFKDPEPEGCLEGSTCRFEGNFNVITQGLRQPGSSFKPFAYLASFIKGLTPDTILFDVPTEFASNNPNCPAIPNYENDLAQCYHPQNFDHIFRGPTTLKESLAESINVTAVKTLYLAGLQNTIDLAEKMGITTFEDRGRVGLSLVLGGGEVKPIEMAEAYSVLANDGLRNPYTFILKIEDKEGKILEEYKDKSERVVEANYTRLISDILSDKNLRAPLFQSSLSLTSVPGYQIAMKTGTTNNYIDAWTFGYTPNLVVGVWAGNNNRYPLQQRGSSILAAVPMWHDFISQAVVKRPNETFLKPEPIGTDIPILRGELDKNNIHNILFYLNRLSDPQYSNWEEGVQNWLKNNVLPDISDPAYSYNKEDEQTSDTGPNIEIIDLNNGDFVSNNPILQFKVLSNIGLQKIEIYINEQLLETITENLGIEFNYEKSIPSEVFKSQNKITILALDSMNIYNQKEIIVYK